MDAFLAGCIMKLLVEADEKTHTKENKRHKHNGIKRKNNKQHRFSKFREEKPERFYEEKKDAI